MAQEYIEIRGARENNLKDVSLRIPKRKITIFTGVSGSGKSSIVFDTIASEARRQLNETFSTFVRNFLPRYAQPEVDAIENLRGKPNCQHRMRETEIGLFCNRKPCLCFGPLRAFNPDMCGEGHGP